jgi:hypothetical protein
MGINRVGNIYFGALERFGCMLLMLISVGCASLFALWATFLYQPSNSMAYDAPAAVTLTTPDDIVFDAPPASATPGLPPSPTVIPTSTSTPNPAPSPTSTPIPTYTPTPAPTATPTPQPILPPPIDSPPGQAFLASMNHEYQKLNNCGPVSLAAAASFFGAEVTQFDAADVVKGSPEDRNVSPQEMVDYLRSLGLGAVYRVNGNEELMKQLLTTQARATLSPTILILGRS